MTNYTISIRPTNTEIQLPTNLSIDPSTPLTWVILLTALLIPAEKTIKSTTSLIQSLTELLKTLTHQQTQDPNDQ